MATSNIFNTTIRGSLIMTGNAIIIAPEGTNYLNAVPAPPSGSVVNNYINNSSAATITIPSTGTMLNTKLVWAGVTGTTSFNIPDSLSNAPVTLTMPTGSKYSISPNLAWQQSLTITGNARGYVNVADITSIVASIPNGFYTVSQIPTVAQFFGGWMMYITYQDQNEPFRNINIWTILSQINAGQTPVDIPVSGFMTPTAGNVTGKLILAAGNGQAQLSGDAIQFGPNTSNLVTLSGPNNPATNFFESQINNNQGLLDTTGSYGTHNTPLGQNPATGDRALWDITRIDASSGLTNSQTSAVIRTLTTFDSYWISSVGLQVDVNAANLSPIIKTVDRGYANIGDTLTYTISFTNGGLVESYNTILTDTIPNGTSFISGSVQVNGVPLTLANPQLGINIGTVVAGSRVTTTFNVLVNTIPSPNPVSNIANVSYDYKSGAGIQVIHDNIVSNVAVTTINHVDLLVVKYVNKTFADIGDILTYTIVLNTIGNTTANNILFIDTIPLVTSFIAGTLKQDNIAVSGSPNPPGVTLPNSIKAGTTSTLTFQVIVTTIPNTAQIPNSAAVIYTYTIDNSTIPNRTAQGSQDSNTVITQIKNANLSSVQKIVDKSFADCGDTLNYTILIPNSGNVTALNVVFKDTIPNGTSFVNNSVYVNNVLQLGANPSTGITIPDIASGITATVMFSVKITCN